VLFNLEADRTLLHFPPTNY